MVHSNYDNLSLIKGLVTRCGVDGRKAQEIMFTNPRPERAWRGSDHGNLDTVKVLGLAGKGNTNVWAFTFLYCITSF